MMLTLQHMFTNKNIPGSCFHFRSSTIWWDGGGATSLDRIEILSSSSADRVLHGGQAHPECGPQRPSQQVQVRI